MQNQTPTVVVGHDMSPELFVDVSATLSSMGVIVKTDGFTATPRRSKVIVVVSPKGGAGKTAVSSNVWSPSPSVTPDAAPSRSISTCSSEISGSHCRCRRSTRWRSSLVRARSTQPCSSCI